MPSIQRTTASSAVSAPTSSKVTANYTHFMPYKATALRDGGSIILNGNLNRSVVGDVRMDGGLNSPTRGKFFASTHAWNAKSGAEKPMTKTELKQLKTALDGFLASTRLDKATGQLYGNFMKQLDAALGTKPAAPTSPAEVSKITTTRLLGALQAELKTGKTKWNASMPLGQRYVEVPLMSEKHPDGFHYSAMVPVGALSPTAKVLDPNQATSFLIKRTGGIAGQTVFGGPVQLRK